MEPQPFSGSVNVDKRRSELKDLNEKFDISQNQFYEMVTYSPVAQFGGDIESHELETADTSAISSMMATTNSNRGQLDYLHGTVTSLKDIGYEINDEINVHSRLLEDIEAKEDSIFHKTKSNQDKLKNFMDNKNNTLFCLWTIVIILFVVFTFVLLK